MSIKDECIEVAANALALTGFSLSPKNQVENIFAYAATDANLAQVITSKDPRVQAELKAQIKYICSLGLDTAKSRKLVYVKTRGVNFGDKKKPNWVTFPDITESYHATIHILVREQALKKVVVQHTYENYTIEYTGDVADVPIVKAWLTKPAERGSYTGCFVSLYLADDLVQTSFHHLDDILNTHQRYSKSSNTWRDHQQAMAAKSAIMDAVRYLPIFNDAVAKMMAHYDDAHDWEDPLPENDVPVDQDSLSWLTDITSADDFNISQFNNYLKMNRIKLDGMTQKQFLTIKKMLEGTKNA